MIHRLRVSSPLTSGKFWVPRRDVRSKKIFVCWDLVYETGNFQKISLFFYCPLKRFFICCCLGSVSQMSLVVVQTILEPLGLELAILVLLGCCLIH